MRIAKATDFFIELPEVGTFRFGRRTYGDRLKVRAEYLRLVQETGDADPDLSMYAAIIASHKVLCVEAPAGWESIEDLDMLSGVDTDDKVFELYRLLKTKEDFFREGQPQSGQDKGAGAA